MDFIYQYYQDPLEYHHELNQYPNREDVKYTVFYQGTALSVWKESVIVLANLRY